MVTLQEESRSKRRVESALQNRQYACGIKLEQIANFAGVADGSDNAVAALEELIGELTTEAAAGPGDKPSAL